ncbi:uncharacterized protein LOC124485088 isoform X3 [Hypomesus transpacificus]|uniref:uncharacterized protein LOC124485088 isoform X3 n=1 Tax=Hypomesus transpacificus TaxID=137520 RepID=UPI001F079268|nr:uncharacterized protein LOC124485088 isoform X3 [Hypomesus transpacificus]
MQNYLSANQNSARPSNNWAKDSIAAHSLESFNMEEPEANATVSQMMQGYLRAEGITVQRRRVREMLTRVDPAAAAQRWSNVVARRSYHVPFPNSLWHIDGHMRLIRVVVATSLADRFITSGLNVFEEMCSSRSVHSFYNLFYSFEEDLILDPNDHIHRFSLHKTYLPEIQNRLDCFRVAWNSHSLRTEHNCTPNQIWMDGMLGNIHQNATAVQRVFGEDPYTEESLETMLGRHDIQLPRLQAEADNDDLDRAVIVEPPPVALTPEQEQALQDALTGITDLKPRYQSCCRVLSEFGIGQ